MLSLAGVLLVCTFAFAQNRVIDTYPAHAGKDLTMEDAVLNGVGYARGNAMWPSRFATAVSLSICFCE